MSLARIEDLIEYLIDKVEDNSISLGLNFVGGYDDKVITGYPAVIFGNGNTTKEVSGTHQFLIQHHLDIYIQHAEATETHRQRSLEMLQTVTKLVAFLEADKTLSQQIIFGYVISERPGLIQPRATPSVFIVSTSITYQATLKVVFA
jgi:hypothetical protein